MDTEILEFIDQEKGELFSGAVIEDVYRHIGQHRVYFTNFEAKIEIDYNKGI